MLDGQPRYDSYKDSGVPWLGAVPSDWDVLPGRACLYESSEKNTGMKEETVLSLSYGRVKVKPVEEQFGLMPESYETYQIVQPGDIIIRGTDLQNDVTSLRTGLAKDHGIITSAYINLRPKPNISPFYLHYLLSSYDDMKVFYGLGSGLRQNLSYDDFKYMGITVPNLDTQNRIVKFLDEKTAEIDAAVGKKRRLIDLLNEQKAILINRAVTKGLNPAAPMKDSGVDWIGEIPAHWDVMFNRRLFREKPRKVDIENEQQLSLSQVDGVIPTKNMTERSLKALNKDNFKLCLPGDLVVNRFKGHLGVFFESRHRGIVTFHYGVFEPSEFAITKYYELLFHTGQYRTVFAGRSNGMTLGLQNLSNQNFYDVKSLVPPEGEQSEIVRYVEEKSKLFERAVALSLREISTLNEFKQTLIANAVTGKIKI